MLVKVLSLVFSLCLFGCVHGKKSVDPKPVDPKPEVLPPPVVPEVTVVKFGFDSAKLHKEQKESITKALVGKPVDAPIRVIGYTDSQGSKKYNLNLSKKRAKSVEKFLKSLKVKGVITVEAKGDTGLLNADKTVEQHKANRRVEVVFVLK